MSPKGVAVIVGVAVVIIAVIFLPVKPNGVPPAIEDTLKIGDNSIIGIDTGSVNEIEINEDTSIEISPGTSDVFNITDTATMEKETSIEYYFNDDGVKYYINENGTKHYALIIEDVQILED